jgi:hypothetical protein
MPASIQIDKTAFRLLLQRMGIMPRAVVITSRSVLRTTLINAKKLAKSRVSGEDLVVRSGSLHDAIDYKLANDRATISGMLGFFNTRNAEVKAYGWAHEVGDEVKPKKPDGVLTQPLDAAEDSRGVPLFTALGAKDHYDATFWHPSQEGNLILFGRTGDEITPLFFGNPGPLKITGEHFLSNSVADSIPLYINTVQSRFGIDLDTILSGGRVVES